MSFKFYYTLAQLQTICYDLRVTSPIEPQIDISSHALHILHYKTLYCPANMYLYFYFKERLLYLKWQLICKCSRSRRET